MLLYADEDFSAPAVKELRRLGHDVLTAQQDNRRQTPDDQILTRAHALGRAVLTHNRFHFVRLHIQRKGLRSIDCPLCHGWVLYQGQRIQAVPAGDNQQKTRRLPLQAARWAKSQSRQGKLRDYIDQSAPGRQYGAAARHAGG
jgi:hypothetical protein